MGALVRIQLFSYIKVKFVRRRINNYNRYFDLNRYNYNESYIIKNNINNIVEKKKDRKEGINGIITKNKIKYTYLTNVLNCNRSSIINSKNVYDLDLNFKRSRFFPQLSFKKVVLLNTSLGVVVKYTNNKKNYIKTKAAHLICITYMTRLLINIGIKNVDINVRRTPNYLVDMINKLLNNEPNKIYYTNPFDKKIKSTSVECKLKINNILFHYSKYFGKLKV